MTKKIPKYYVYISDTKVDMLFGGIPESLLKKVTASLQIDLRFVKATVTGEFQRKLEHRVQRLETVISYLRDTAGFGTLDEPDQYVSDHLNMKSSEITPLIYLFGGATDRTTVALSGSPKHKIGNPGTAAISASFAQPLLDVLRAKRTESEPTPSVDDDSLTVIELGVCTMRGASEAYEFVAKRLLYGPGENGKVLLATPLYVASL